MSMFNYANFAELLTDESLKILLEKSDALDDYTQFISLLEQSDYTIDNFADNWYEASSLEDVEKWADISCEYLVGAWKALDSLFNKVLNKFNVPIMLVRNDNPEPACEVGENAVWCLDHSSLYTITPEAKALNDAGIKWQRSFFCTYG